MWSVKTLPKASVSSAGGCFGLVVRVMAIWVKAVSHSLAVRRSATLYPIGVPMPYSTVFTITAGTPSGLTRSSGVDRQSKPGSPFQRAQDRAVAVDDLLEDLRIRRRILGPSRHAAGGADLERAVGIEHRKLLARCHRLERLVGRRGGRRWRGFRHLGCRSWHWLGLGYDGLAEPVAGALHGERTQCVLGLVALRLHALQRAYAGVHLAHHAGGLGAAPARRGVVHCEGSGGGAQRVLGMEVGADDHRVKPGGKPARRARP